MSLLSSLIDLSFFPVILLEPQYDKEEIILRDYCSGLDQDFTLEFYNLSWECQSEILLRPEAGMSL